MSFQFSAETILFDIQNRLEILREKITELQTRLIPIPEPIIITDTQQIQGGFIVQTSNIQNRVAINAAIATNSQINSNHSPATKYPYHPAHTPPILHKYECRAY